MKLAVMQPYFLPYIGYFQLMAAVDRFVIFDDVSFINRGWVNRNRILIGGKDHMMTVPLKGASQNLQIRQLDVAGDLPWRTKLLRSVEQAYKRAPYFDETWPLACEIVDCAEQNLAAYLAHGLVAVRQWLGIECEMVMSSAVYGNGDLKGEARIRDICRREGATEYFNLPGGKSLYDAATFQEH